jgi:hypothetical protein
MYVIAPRIDNKLVNEEDYYMDNAELVEQIIYGLKIMGFYNRFRGVKVYKLLGELLKDFDYGPTFVIKGDVTQRWDE